MEDDLAAAMAMSLEPAAGHPDPGPAAAAVATLQANAAVLAEAGSVSILSTLLNNLVKNPAEEKFRRVKLANAKISKALSCPGAEDLLLAAGFTKTGETLEVPADRPAEQVKAQAEQAMEALSALCGDFVLAAQFRAEGEVRCVAALREGGVAFAGMDNLVHLCHPPAPETRVLSGHQRRAGVDGVLALCDGDDSVDVVSAGRDGTIIFWREGEAVESIKGHGENIQGTNVHVVSALGRTSDGRLISGGWDKTVRVWKGDQPPVIMAGHDIAINAVAGLDSGDIVSGSGDQTIGVWRDGQKLRSLPAKQVVRALCACGGTLVAAGGNDGVVRLWDTAAGQAVAERQVAPSYVLALARRQTGEIAAGTSDGQVFILVHEGSSLRQSADFQVCGEVYGLSFLPNGDLAVACGDCSCTVWTRSLARAAPQAIREEFGARAAALAATRAPAVGGGVGASGGGGGASYDFTFPVEFGSQKFSLSWNRGEDPKAVAERFIRESQLDSRHTGDVVAFVMQAMQQQGAQHGQGMQGIQGGAKDFNFPVEVADGRRLTISWNRGDDPQQVALDFARQHGGIGAAELPDIANFIQQASGQPGPVPTFQQAAPAPTPVMQQQLVQQITAMGFPDAMARSALEAANWDIESAISRLLG
ncbi:lub1 [Symbiodinium natans]|uniref:Lub1 protein n=1 Tax=Symbiodinium natans TaxID=878477 RepID=A0A812GH34_9DINO|nr:lub1 [Symbiodinium natans]